MPSSNSPFAVFGTGLDASGHVLAAGAADPHYALISGPSTAAPVVLPQGGFPFPYWDADDANSAWITPGDAVSNPANAANGYQEPQGDSDYQTKFDLTGYDPTTASLIGLIGADNRVMEVLLNGVDVAGFTPTAEGGNDFASLRSLDITSGFQAGVNTLDFVVENYAGDSFNPTGFRAQLSGTAQLTGATFGLFGTGVDNSGALLAGGASDPHWQLVSAPETISTAAPYVTIQNGYPFPYWTADGPNSQWISPNANENDYAGGATDAVGYYTYQATFDLDGFDPSTAHIAGLVSADNTLEQVLLNGQDVGYMPDPSGTDYTSLHSLVIDSGFVSGINTLTFVVYNAPNGPDGPADNAHNPSAFRAELSGTATAVPVLANPGPQTDVVGDQVVLPLNATDANGDALTYSAANLPAGLSIDPTYGFISGQIAVGADAASPYSVTVTASDGAESASQTFAWTVGHFAIPNPGDQTNAVGDSVYVSTGGSDPDGDALTFTAADLPPGLSIESDNGLITGTIADTATEGVPYAVTLTATDGTSSASQTFNWTVTHVFVVNPGDQTNADGDSVILPINAGDNYDAPVTYGAVGLPTGLSINAEGNIVGTISQDADANSPYTVTVSAGDGAYSDSQTFQWTVS